MKVLYDYTVFFLVDSCDTLFKNKKCAKKNTHTHSAQDESMICVHYTCFFFCVCVNLSLCSKNSLQVSYMDNKLAPSVTRLFYHILMFYNRNCIDCGIVLEIGGRESFPLVATS